jgi:cytochrome c oxidase assembly protein subunit 15
VIGGIQWALELPAALVWVHIAVATTTWLAMLWTVAVAGRLEPRPEHAPAREPEPAERREPLGSSAA